MADLADLASYIWPDVAQGRQPKGAVPQPTKRFRNLWLATPAGMQDVVGSAHAYTNLVYGGNTRASISHGRQGLGVRGEGTTSNAAKGYETAAGAVDVTSETALTLFCVLSWSNYTAPADAVFLRSDQDGADVNAQFSLSIISDAGGAIIRSLVSTTSNTGWTASVDQGTGVQPINGELYVLAMRWISTTKHQVSLTKVGNPVVWQNSPFIPGGGITTTGGVATNFQTHFQGSAYATTSTYSSDSWLHAAGCATRCISDQEFQDIVSNPWDLFATPSLGAAMVPAAGAGSHTTTSALAASAAAIAGTSTHLTLHTTNGALTGQAATIAGTALHPHATTGALVSGAATIAGTATHTTAGSHATSGALAANAATIAGTSVHLTLHTTTGALAASASIIAGTSLRVPAAVTHTTSGALVAGSATIAGSAIGPGAVTGGSVQTGSGGGARSGGGRELRKLIDQIFEKKAKPVAVAKAIISAAPEIEVLRQAIAAVEVRAAKAPASPKVTELLEKLRIAEMEAEDERQVIKLLLLS